MNRSRDRDEIREMVRDHGLIIFRMGPDATVSLLLGRELPTYEGSSRERFDEQFAPGRTYVRGGRW